MCECNATGIVKVVNSNMMFTRSCTCDIARRNLEQSDRELRQMLEQSKRDQATRLRELMANA